MKKIIFALALLTVVFAACATHAQELPRNPLCNKSTLAEWDDLSDNATSPTQREYWGQLATECRGDLLAIDAAEKHRHDNDKAILDRLKNSGADEDVAALHRWEEEQRKKQLELERQRRQQACLAKAAAIRKKKDRQAAETACQVGN